MVTVIAFRDGEVGMEHIYWDQASELEQIELLSSSSLPMRPAEGTAQTVRAARQAPHIGPVTVTARRYQSPAALGGGATYAPRTVSSPLLKDPVAGRIALASLVGTTIEFMISTHVAQLLPQFHQGCLTPLIPKVTAFLSGPASR